MKRFRIAYLFVIFELCHILAFAQVDSVQADTAKADSIQTDSTEVDAIRADTVKTDSTTYDPRLVDTTVLVLIPEPVITDSTENKPKPLFKIIPWEFHAPLEADTAATDSTLRWQYWPDWSYKLNREPGIISYRMGNNARTNTVQRYAHEPRYQELYWEDIPLNDPVSGALHWSLIPKNKIGTFYEQDLGVKHRSTYYLRQYYLNQPLTRLIYNESKFDTRNLEFEVSHNLSQRTNIEASYWDRRIGGEYDNLSSNGRQIFVKASHHLDKRRYLKLNYISTKYNVGRPFGYAISDLRFFNFDQYTATPNEPNGGSDETSSILALNLYQRSADSTHAIDNLHGGIFYKGTERSVTYSADSTHYKVQSLGLHARKWWGIGGLQLEADGRYQYFLNKNDKSLSTSNWSLLDTEGKVSLDYTPVIDLNATAGFQLRSDGYSSYRLSATSNLKIGKFTISPGASAGSIMPTPQQLYWNSNSYTGNTGLLNEQVREVRGTVSYDIAPNLKVGIRAQHKDIGDGIMVENDNTFGNVSLYASQAAAAFADWDRTHWEFDGSATVHRFTNSLSVPDQPIPMFSAERVWLAGSAYWKGYFLSRATYLKAGLSGMISPFNYQADHYNPELDYWQPLSTDQPLPVYNRLDVDISVRVRWIMFILRWENVLDDFAQLGYFETANYPMVQRRFIFTVRAIFRN